MFTADDLARLTHGKASLDRDSYRKYRQRPVSSFEALAVDGVLQLPPGKTPEGAPGWQVLPPEGFGPD